MTVWTQEKRKLLKLLKLLAVAALLVIATVIPICIMAAVETAEDGDEPRIALHTGSIGGKLWHDANADGICDAGEQPVANYLVSLYAQEDPESAVQTTVTNADGAYAFAPTEPGRYVVRVKAATVGGVAYLVPTAGITADNQFICPNGDQDTTYVLSNPVEIALDTEATNIDAGMRTIPELLPAQLETDVQANRISGIVWHDGNENGIYDVGEPPIANYRVYLCEENDSTTAVHAAETDANGQYTFTNVVPGVYVVGLHAATVDGTDYIVPTNGVSADNKFVSRDAPEDNTSALSVPVEMAADTEVTDINAGMWAIAALPAQQETEPQQQDDPRDQEQASDPQGQQADPRDQEQASDPQEPENEAQEPVEPANNISGMLLHDADERDTYDADMRTRDESQTQNSLLSGINSISGGIWHDIDGNGAFDGTDYAIAEYPVYLYREGDTENAVQTTVTDADGQYAFANIEPGSYVVGVKPVTILRSEYVVPSAGIAADNVFIGGDADATLALSMPLEIEADTAIQDINAGMRMRGYTQTATTETAAFGAGTFAAGDVTVDKTKTPQDLVNLLLGTGVKASNIKIVGTNRMQYGIFASGKDVFGIDSGIVLSTGNASKIQPTDKNGPNAEYGTTAYGSNRGDLDLEAVLYKQFGKGFYTDDVCILEFDFVPDTPYFTFNYVFASEEYNEFVDVGFNDVFAFFINGANYALVPGTNDIVSVDTINYKANKAYFVNNNPHNGSPIYPDYGPRIPQDQLKRTEMDGFTVVMQIQAKVNAGKTNHIKLAIADVLDSMYDANVLIAGARSELPTVWLDPVSIVVYEDVAGGSVSFTVHRDITLDKSRVNFTLTDGTAKAGVDYNDVSQTVQFNAGEATKVVTIPIHNRSGYQGDRSFAVKLETALECKIGTPYEGTVTIKEVESKPTSYQITEKFVDRNGVVFDTTNLPNNVVNVPIGNNYTASGIPTNHTMANGDVYAYSGYKWDSYTAIDTPTSGTPSNVVISGDRDVYYVYDKKAYTSISISKAVTGEYAEKTKDFTFTIYFADASGNKLAAGTQFYYTGQATPGSGATAPANGTLTLDADGKQTFTLRHGQSITIAGVSITGKVRIVEETSPGYDVSFKDSEQTNVEKSADTGMRDLTNAGRSFAFENAKTETPPTGLSTGDTQGQAIMMMLAMVLVIGLAAEKKRLSSMPK